MVQLGEASRFQMKDGGVWVGFGIDKINVKSLLYGSDAWVLVRKVDVPAHISTWCFLVTKGRTWGECSQNICK
jgi:hypothetical protein